MNLPRRLSEATEHPWYFGRKVNRMWHRRGGQRDHNPNGVRWMDEDWDVLIVLDACRYDLFDEVADLPGTLNQRESVECATAQVLREQWNQKTHHDTVYVTAMPVLYNGQRDQLINRDPIQTEFHAQIDVWKENGWDDEFRTVLPEVMVDHALQAAEEYPNKQLIVHFSQPHCPFIGQTGQEYYEPDKRAFWSDVMDGRVDLSHINKAYRENLEAVLPAVYKLMVEIEGKHVVTADHGQALGERAFPIPMKEWGHPPGIYIDEIINVPWLEYYNRNRRKITETQPTKKVGNIDEDVVRDRLADLGYMN